MNLTLRISIPLLLAALAGAPISASIETVQAHVRKLAAPELAGRMTGTDGEAGAVAYIETQLREMGAIPLTGQQQFKLPFEFTAGMDDGGSWLQLHGAELEAGPRFEGEGKIQALSFSDNASVTGPVVFAGYGLRVPEGKEISYDSYHGLDVKDKIVLVLRYFPEDAEPDTRSVLARYSGLRYKALQARELGARAMLVATGPRSPNAGETIPMTFDTALSGSGLVAASIGSALTDAIFERLADTTLEQVQRSMDDANPHVTGFEIPGLTLTIDTRVERERRTAYNVVGMLPATVPDPPVGLPVLLGAHLDHLGDGRRSGNSLARKGEVGQPHLGADDNASGVAAVLEAGARLVEQPRRRAIVLAFWSGEELGLLGSSQFIKDAQLEPDRLMAYLNFDMVGRMRDNRLTLQAVGSSTSWPRLIEQTNVAIGFDVNTQEDPYLPTDVTAFYQAGVPCLNFFTGSHEDYHRPTDTLEKINFEDLERVARFGALMTQKLSRLDQRPDYVKVTPTRQESASRDTLRAFTGTIPDYTVEVDGLRLSGVVGGGPADLAGLREGVVIVELAGQKISNIYDYTYALDAVKIDQPAVVVFMREGERMEATITPTVRE